MAQPITWRNIEAPRTAEALAGMAAAQQSFNSGLGVLDRLLVQHQGINEANWQQGKTNNTNQALDMILGARSNEELESRRAALASLQQGAGAQIDSSAVRQALDQRPDTLRTREAANINHQNLVEENALRPELQGLLARAYRGDAGVLTAASPELMQRHGGALSQALTAAQRAQGQDRREQDAAALRLREFDHRVKVDGQNYGLSQERNAISWAQLANAGKGNGPSDKDYFAQATARAKYISENGVLGNGTVDSPDGLQKGVALLKAAGIEGPVLERATNYLSGLRTVPVVGKDGNTRQMPVPVITAVQAILKKRKDLEGSEGTFLRAYTNAKDPTTKSIQTALEETYKDPAFISELQRSLAARGFLEDGGDPREFLGLPAPAAPAAPAGPGQNAGSGYSTVLGNGKYGSPARDLTTMPIGEAMAFGRKTLQANSRKAGVGVNERGEVVGSSAMGAYQITASTLEDFGPKVLGPQWRMAPFTPENQERLAEAIFEARKGGNLAGTWEGLKNVPGASVPGVFKNRSWAEVRELIASVESGGLPQQAAPAPAKIPAALDPSEEVVPPSSGLRAVDALPKERVDSRLNPQTLLPKPQPEVVSKKPENVPLAVAQKLSPEYIKGLSAGQAAQFYEYLKGKGASTDVMGRLRLQMQTVSPKELEEELRSLTRSSK